MHSRLRNPVAVLADCYARMADLSYFAANINATSVRRRKLRHPPSARGNYRFYPMPLCV